MTFAESIYQTQKFWKHRETCSYNLRVVIGQQQKQVTSQWLLAVEQLSVVEWQNPSHNKTFNNKKYIVAKSFQTRNLEKRFKSLKVAWRRRVAGTQVGAHDKFYFDMIAARKAAQVSYARDKRKKHRGDWAMVKALSSGQRFAAMWRKLTPKERNCDLDKSTLRMIEEGVKQVAQTGFPHNELQSDLWKSEMQAFTATPTDVPDEVLHSNHLWKLRNGKATGEDGWCEEWLGLLRTLCTESRTDLDNLLRLVGKYAVLPRHHRGSLVKPILKPGKQGRSHNEFRKLSLMSVVRKQVEKLGSVLMKPFWTSGAYQGGFKPHKRATGRIFILLATISTALWPVTDVETGNGECGAPTC